MTLGLIFWILMLLWLIASLYPWFGQPHPYATHVNSLLLFILFLVLGWKIFGAPIHA